MKKHSKKAKQLKKVKRKLERHRVSNHTAPEHQLERLPLTSSVSEPRPKTEESEFYNLIENHDEQGLSRAKAHWFFGEWQKLADLDEATLAQHPDRDRMALLVASAHQQLDNHDRARKFTRMALTWGCDKQVVAQVLIAGVHNTLGKIAALKGDSKGIEQHFTAAITVGGHRDKELIAHTRSVREMTRLGLINEAATLVDQKIESSNKQPLSIDAQKIIQQQQQLIKARLHDSSLATLKPSPLNDPQDDDELTRQLELCFATADFHASADALLLSDSVSNETKFKFCCLMAERLKALGDRLLAVNFVNNAQLFISAQPQDAEAQYRLLSQLASNVQEVNLSIQLLINAAEHSEGYDEAEKNRLKATYAALIAASSKRQQHGQDLLLSYIKDNPPKPDAAYKPLLIEIGTTRENVPGQGSTRQFFTSCQEHKIDFTTVDMDPHNSRWAAWSFKNHDSGFEAVTMKGEEYLRQLDRPIDYIFLDAYDFDHGNHSEQRQQRYQQFLGERIDEQHCHIMHLDCAQSVAEKITADGVVCVDDTWLDDNNQWTAKGTLAVPYLLEHGFEIIEARNRAVLMKRVQQ